MLTHLYTGDGKGKSTAAAGLALRALAQGWPVLVLRFLKGKEAGEDRLLRKLGADVRLEPNALPPWKRGVEDLRRDCLTLLNCIDMTRLDGGLILCDELVGALNKGALTKEEVCDLLDCCGGRVELVLTGRNAPAWLAERCDYHTEMLAHRHPFTRGVAAREGVEY